MKKKRYNIKGIWRATIIPIIFLFLFVFAINSCYLYKLNNNTKQMEFAQLNPIMPQEKEEAVKYYQENGIEFPDNPYFKDYFDIPQEEEPQQDFMQGMVTSHPLYNKSSSYKVEVPKKDLSADLADYTIVAPKATTIAGRHNNPGNLMFAKQPLAVKGEARKTGGFWARYKSLEEGFISLMKQVDLDKSRGHTVKSFLNKYAPSHENDTTSYINNVSKELNVTPDTSLTQIRTFDLAKIIAKIESGTRVVPKER